MIYKKYLLSEFLTSVTVPSYAYTLIKIGYLKQLLMDKSSFQKLDEITDINEFIEYISVYYPGLSFNAYTIEDIERALFHTYIKLIGKILSYSPENMRNFLKNFLTKFEIMNIKHVILGTILGMSTQEKSKMVNMLVEKYLNNTDFMKSLIEISSLDQIQLFLRRTKYHKVIREGILYFKKTNEIFVLEAFLDQLFYNTLADEIKFLNPKEKELISFYIRYVSEIYNLNIIYRGIKNNIDRNLLQQFLVDTFLFFDSRILLFLMEQSTIEDFISMLYQLLGRIGEFRSLFSKFEIDRNHIIWSVETLYLDYFFKKFKMRAGEIEYLTIFKIMEVLIKKDKEIRLYILPKLVNLINEKYKIL
ncbi:MAG: V-type ATPase subunit [Candidatus Thorarchaeota archaeon]